MTTLLYRRPTVGNAGGTKHDRQVTCDHSSRQTELETIEASRALAAHRHHTCHYLTDIFATDKSKCTSDPPNRCDVGLSRHSLLLLGHVDRFCCGASVFCGHLASGQT
jgi:hypothetical protein